MKCIVGATLLPVTGKKITDGMITFDKGKIRSVGKRATPPKGAEVIRAEGKFVTPGLIDAHTHLGVHEVGIREEGSDYNEPSGAVNAQLRAIDAINPDEKGFEYARCGGVTTVCVTPGSANPVGGLATAIKTCGKVVDEMVIKEKVGVKAAFGENPKRVGRELNRAPYTRMSTAACLRAALVSARNYIANKEWARKKNKKMPDVDLANETLEPVLKRRLPLRVHAHRADDIVTAVRIAEEFGVRMVFEHGTEAHKIADWLATKKIPVVAGPALGTPSKIETQGLTFKALKKLDEAGVLYSITTDHPVVGIHVLLMCAIMAVKEGLSEAKALEAVTINPAKILGLEKRVGSLEAGKDADLVIFSGDPFDARSLVEKTIIDGKVVFDADTADTPM
jgi:imidazolonepropionase-like amidohydrolase